MPGRRHACAACGAAFAEPELGAECPLCGEPLPPVVDDPERVLHRGKSCELVTARMGRMQVVIKRARADRRGDPRVAARLRREAQLLRRVASPHVIALLHAREHGDLPELVLPRYEGSLRDADVATLERTGGLPAIALAIARGLAAIHAHGALHRDLAPKNVLFARSRPIVIADLGHAHRPGIEPLTPEGHTVGTVGYIAPEVLRGEPATAASDVYAWAVTLFELATGQRPFEHPDPAVEMDRAQREHPFPLRTYIQRVAYPAELEETIDCALAPAAEARPRVDDLLDASTLR